MYGDGTVRYFWSQFVAQGYQILESVSLVDLDAFSEGIDIIDRVEGLYFDLT
ncbi:unnamed protein product [Calypogeia fissa]